MKSRILTKTFVAALLLLQPQVSLAGSNGASECYPASAAVDGFHLRGLSTVSGELLDYDLQVTLDGIPLSTATPMNFTSGVSHTLELTGASFRGFLFRLDSGDNNVDTSEALTESSALAKIAESVCVAAYGVGGVTHTSSTLKPSTQASLLLDELDTNLPLDVTVVIQNTGLNSQYYFNRYFLNSVETPNSTPQPTPAPVSEPTTVPTSEPTPTLSAEPTPAIVPPDPTAAPTPEPTQATTPEPTTPAPSPVPTLVPTLAPRTVAPVQVPDQRPNPTSSPILQPTSYPSKSLATVVSPTHLVPTTIEPVNIATDAPFAQPSDVGATPTDDAPTITTSDAPVPSLTTDSEAIPTSAPSIMDAPIIVAPPMNAVDPPTKPLKDTGDATTPTVDPPTEPPVDVPPQATQATTPSPTEPLSASPTSTAAEKLSLLSRLVSLLGLSVVFLHL